MTGQNMADKQEKIEKLPNLSLELQKEKNCYKMLLGNIL
jgi:hypothetical protein